MEWIDTHAHLYLNQFDADREEMLSRALLNGVSAFFLPNIDSSSIEPMLRLEAAHPQTCFPMMGLHPCSVRENFREELDLASSWINRRPFAAIGECGLDLYWDKTFLKQQIEALNIQLDWAKQLELPIVLHTRDAMDLTIDVVKNAYDSRLSGVFHCFNGTVEQAARILEMGFFLGIGGVLTYKNGGLEPVINAFGLDNIVLETDAPYLSPNPYRGKRNESAYIPVIGQHLSAISGQSLEQVAATTTANAKILFAKTDFQVRDTP